MDTDLCGFCSEQFHIQGLAYTVGGASASGQLAVIRAVEAVLYQGMDVCIALGALSDISYFELYALQSLGAMGGVQIHSPQKACRPFDLEREGFIYGENCAAIVVEKMDTAEARHVEPYAEITGWGVCMDGNRNPDPGLDGEIRAIKKALASAGLKAGEIDYVNPHGTGSKRGDETELRALRECGLLHAYINTTKSMTGHGLSAAGAVEIVATLLQMKSKKLHPSLNLEHPLDEQFNWVKDQDIQHNMVNAISLSYGFGGLNTAVCLHQIGR
jgi:malonyl-ACP decarboxylase